MKNNFHIISLILLAGAIALSPSFVVGEITGTRPIEIRVEDILIVVFGFIWIASLFFLRIKKIEKPPLFLPILVWLSIGFLSTLTNWIFSELSLSRGFFYFLKEIQFFVFYFYVFYCIRKINSAKIIINVWLFLGFLNVLYVFYQIFSRNNKGEYGTAAVCEWGVFPTGAFFLLLFIFLFNIFLYYFLDLNIHKIKKIILGIIIASLFIGIIGSASKTNLIAGILSMFFIFLFYFLKKRSFKKILIFILMVIFISISIFCIINILPAGERLTTIFNPQAAWENYKAGRVEAVIKIEWENFLKDPSFIFLGRGKGFVGEAHNQYLRNLIEVGIIGSFMFFVLIFAIIKKTWQVFLKSRDGLAVGLSAGLLVATLIMLFFSFATEPFIVVKPASVYWFFAGITMAVLRLKPSY